MGGGPSQATKDQQQVNLDASKQQLAFDSQLMDLFQKQYANQQTQLSYLKGILQPEITQAQAGHGFSDAALAAMRTGATDSTSQAFQNAQKTLNTQERASGDVNIPSGVNEGLDAGLLNSEAQTKAGAQNQITQADFAQSQSNLWNSVNALNGIATESNPAYLAGSATSGSGAIAGLGTSQANLQNAITTANNSTFWHQLGSSFANGLGGSLAGAATGGLGMALPFSNPF